MLSSSLGKWEELRLNEAANIPPREDGQVFDVLRNYIDEEDGGSTKDIAFCRVVSLVPFTTEGGGFYGTGYEMAIGIALALSHLNEGNGTFVPDVVGLNERCNIRFTAEFIDTQHNAGIVMNQIVKLTDTSRKRLPSAFLGAYRSSVSGPSSMITALQGYPQISGASTSAQLDDKEQYPKFARTIPSDDGVAKAIVEYLSISLGLEHVAVININDAFGNSFARGLKHAAGKNETNMNVIQIPFDETEESIHQAIVSLKQSNYKFVFCIAFFPWHDTIMTEASRMGLAGDGVYNWIFADPFAGTLDGRKFEQDSVLQKAYHGTGMLTSSAKTGLKFQSFSDSMQALKNENDMQYLNAAFPHFDQTPYFEVNSTFMDPIIYDYTMFFYDAAILMGLAACDAVGENLTMTGDTFYHRIVNSPSFQGLSGTVVLDPTTGTREPHSAYYTLSNYVEREIRDEETGKTMIEFETFRTDQYSNGTWLSIVNYTFNDGTSNQPLGIPSYSIEENFIQSWIRAIMCILCAGAMLLSIAFTLWIWLRRRTRVVRASQPFFLLLICLGCFIMASGIIPLQFDHQIADLYKCTIACNAIVWQEIIGFGIVSSSVVCKTHRINVLMRNSARFSRIKVTVRDTIKPVFILTSLNIILLSLMTALNPLTFEIQIVRVDEFDRPLETYPYCSKKTSLCYLIPLVVLNMTSAIIAIYEAWRARKIATEFSESQYIFKALISILLVVFIGGPITFIANDNPNALAFISSVIIFVSVSAILLFMFVPKILFEREHEKKRKQKIIARRKYSSPIRSNAVGSLFESNCVNTGSSGEQILTSKTQKELSEEVELLKKLLNEVTEKRNTECKHCEGGFVPLQEFDSSKRKCEDIGNDNMNNEDSGQTEESNQKSSSESRSIASRSLGESYGESIGYLNDINTKEEEI
uniref:G-protein coupled receptors family 3 profile domain-containing protein n=1 Tax=Pseudo-nitzschia australis TaxID=44445 RepID=A0A7S4AFU2_9STRA